MTVSLGTRQDFAIEIGEPLPENPSLRPVDLWVAGQWLTCDDNLAYVPPFVHTVRGDINSLQSANGLGMRKFTMPFHELAPERNHMLLLADETGRRENFWFFNWGPTTDNVLAHLFGDKDRLVLTVEFWRADHHRPQDLGQIFVAGIPRTDFIAVLEAAIDVLEPSASVCVRPE